MSKKIKIAYLSSFAPRVCGIASFTRDLISANNKIEQVRESKVIAINRGKPVDYGPKVVYDFDDSNPTSYSGAAEYLNQSDFDVVSLQHEYGLYRGDMGEYIISLVKNLKKPLITTFHMVSPIKEATTTQIKITQTLANYSQSVVVMTKVASESLKNSYHIDPGKIKIIPHGTPTVSLANSAQAKDRLGIKNNATVLLSINIIRASRGIDLVIKALPPIIKVFPNLVYLIVGRDPQGEKTPTPYRQKLVKMVSDLHLQKQVIFINKYVSLKELKELLSAADIFITPYRPPEQSSSGSLAYAVAAGKVCISTPYNYAKELLSNNRGVIVPWLDPKAIKKAVISLLKNRKIMNEISKNAYIYGKNMTWASVARQYVSLFKNTIKTLHPQA